jgi:hypothetical protein
VVRVHASKCEALSKNPNTTKKKTNNVLHNTYNIYNILPIK